MPYDKQWCLKFPLINVEFRVHGAMGRKYEWGLRDLNSSPNAAKT